jgi:predicted DsbA family dithiol-disulfide isomerase
VRVEIWSDVVCPWCYVGTRRFERAVDRLADEGIDVEVVHRTFELDPSVPAAGMDLAEYLARKFGGAGRVGHVHDRLDEAGRELGIEFRWAGKRRINTFDAHRLTAWALDTAGSDVQHALHQRLFRAYFTDNVDVGDHAVLAELAGEVGLDSGVATKALATDAYADTVLAEEATARENDIHAVPTFVIEGSWAIPGAQDVHTFSTLLRRAHHRLAPLTADASTASTGDGCDDGACEA